MQKISNAKHVKGGEIALKPEKALYQTPEASILTFVAKDIITTSNHPSPTSTSNQERM